MAGRVHQIDLIGLAVFGSVHQAHGLRLNSNAALTLDIHSIEHLFLELSALDATTFLDQSVGKGRFAVIDMRDNREIANVGKFYHCARNIGGTGRRSKRSGTVALNLRPIYAASPNLR